MAGGVATDSSYLQSGIKVCDFCVSSLSQASSLLKSYYQEAGSGWTDKHYVRLGAIVGDCCKALSQPISGLNNCKTGLGKLLSAVQEYESFTLSGEFGGSSGGSLSNGALEGCSSDLNILGTNSANSVVRSDGTRYRTDDNGNIHMAYNSDTHRYDLIPNNTYVSNGYTYTTDGNGRISSVEGTLHLSSEKRGSINTSVSDMLPTDERGHIIAAQFDASNRVDNLVAMDHYANHSTYREFEEIWEKALKDGQEVSVSIELIYADSSHRPDGIMIRYIIDGAPFSGYVSNG